MLRATGALWLPLLGPQNDAYESQADELFYGGAAGGSKSQLLLGLSITAHLQSIIFRREFTQLTGATGLIEKSREILADSGARYNGQEYTWRDVPGGRSVEFGAVKQAADWRKYQGRPHDFLGFDELPEFTERQYRALIGWCRTEFEGQRCRIVGTGNPPSTQQGRWVIKYWGPWLDPQHPNPAEPGELRWFAVLDGQDVEVDGPAPIEHKGETIQPRSRSFIPASLIDNPYYMVTGYEAVLQGMPEPLRSQLLYGDFMAAVEDDPWQVIPTEWVLAAQARWTSDPPKDENGATVPLSSVGVDVARGGRDQTVISRRFDNWFAPLVKYPGTATPDGPTAAAKVKAELYVGHEQVPLNVDIIGVGTSVYDTLRGWGYNAVGVDFGAGTKGRDKTGMLGFRNIRAEAYWRVREALDPMTGDDLMLPDDPELLADLTAPKWRPMTSGIQVESKQDIITRIGRSPDCGDAVVLAHYARGGVYLAFV